MRNEFFQSKNFANLNCYTWYDYEISRNTPGAELTNISFGHSTYILYDELVKIYYHFFGLSQ